VLHELRPRVTDHHIGPGAGKPTMTRTALTAGR
jgi:hypothetical protein